jgi:tripartite-type tricarboxylate transporter receptor subunit TctC
MTKLMLSFLMLVFTALTFSTAAAQPVRVVVPTGPGGGLDIMSRTIAVKLEEIWKSSVIVENRPGGNGMIATNFLLSAPSDGRTMLFYSSSTYSALQGMTTQTDFVWQKQLEPLNTLWAPPFVLVVNSARNIKTMSDLQQSAQQKGLTYGSTAGGSPLHIYGAVAAEKMNITGITVAYKGVPQILVDIMNNQLDYAVLNWSNVAQLVAKGNLTPLFVFDIKPLSEYPNLPTLKDRNYSEYQTLLQSYGFFVKKDTPNDIKESLRRDIDRAIQASMAELIQKNLVNKSGDTRHDLNQLIGSGSVWERTANKLSAGK